MKKNLSPSFTLLIVTLTILGFCISPGKAQADNKGLGKDYYRYYCAQCHGVKGDGKGVNATEDLPTQPKDFTSPKNLPVFSDQQIINTITHGGPSEQLSFIMPPWGEILSTNEVEILRAHLRVICNCTYQEE